MTPEEKKDVFDVKPTRSVGAWQRAGARQNKTMTPHLTKEEEKEFDNQFYKNHSTRQWISRSGESYDSEHPQMGRAELLRYIAALAHSREQKIIRDMK